MTLIEEIAEKVVARAEKKLPVLWAKDPNLNRFRDGLDWDNPTTDARFIQFMWDTIHRFVPDVDDATPAWCLEFLTAMPELAEEGAIDTPLTRGLSMYLTETILELAEARVRAIGVGLGFDIDAPEPSAAPSP